MLPHAQHGRGRAIVLLPGLEGSREVWARQVEPLARLGRVVTCDLAPRPPSPRRSVSEDAADVRALLDGLGIDRAVVMGFSYGGLVALALALAEPGRVEALALASSLARMAGPPLGLDRATLATALLPLAIARRAPRPLAEPVLRAARRHRAFFLDDGPGAEAVVAYARRHAYANGVGALVARVIAAARSRLEPELGRLRLPALLLRGADDRIVREADLAGLAARVPGARAVTVAGGGHCFLLSSPAAAAEALCGWVEGLGGGRC